MISAAVSSWYGKGGDGKYCQSIAHRSSSPDPDSLKTQQNQTGGLLFTPKCFVLLASPTGFEPVLPP
jgi:hypothetical protein